MTSQQPQDSRRPLVGRRLSRTHEALLNNPYGLSIREVKAEIRRLSARGWQTWEISLRFARTRKDNVE